MYQIPNTTDKMSCKIVPLLLRSLELRVRDRYLNQEYCKSSEKKHVSTFRVKKKTIISIWEGGSEKSLSIKWLLNWILTDEPNIEALGLPVLNLTRAHRGHCSDLSMSPLRDSMWILSLKTLLDPGCQLISMDLLSLLVKIVAFKIIHSLIPHSSGLPSTLSKRAEKLRDKLCKCQHSMVLVKQGCCFASVDSKQVFKPLVPASFLSCIEILNPPLL